MSESCRKRRRAFRRHEREVGYGFSLWDGKANLNVLLICSVKKGGRAVRSANVAKQRKVEDMERDDMRKQSNADAQVDEATLEDECAEVSDEVLEGASGGDGWGDALREALGINSPGLGKEIAAPRSW